MRTIYTALAFTALLATPALASVDSILDASKRASGGDAWASKSVLNTEYSYSGQGMSGKTWSMIDLKDGRFVDNYAIGPATGANGFDGTQAWVKDSSGMVTAQESADSRHTAVNQAYRYANMWWRKDRGGATIVSQGQKTDGGKTFDVLTVTPKDGKVFDAWFDTQTHLLARIVEKQGAQTITSSLSEYHAVDGVVLPIKATVDGGEGPKYVQTLMLTSATFMAAQDASVFAAPKSAVTDFSIAGGAPRTTVPIQLINNHIYGGMMVNGKGPYTCIFDTGGVNLITPKVAKALKLKTEGKMDVHGAGEGIMEAGMTKVREVKIGNATLKDQVFIVLPLDDLSNVEGIEEKGMVGFETFRRFVTQIDYAGKTLTLIDPKHFDPKDAGTPVKFVFKEHIPEVEGSFEGITGKFDIDTGSRQEITLNKPFVEKNDLRGKHPKGVEAVDGWGVGGPSRAYVTRGAKLTIGEVEVSDVVTSLATQEKGTFAGEDSSGNIGSGLLKRFIVTFDYENKIMYLKPAAGPLTDVGTFDRAGMWINNSKAGFKIVDVTATSPAEEAGLKAGDVITAVDGKPAATIKLSDLRQRLRNDPVGSKVNFTLQGGRKVTVTLRDLI